MHIESFTYERGHQTPWHQHQTGQLYWLTRGVLLVEMTEVQWTVMPGTLGWFPGGCHHRAHVPARLQGKSVYPGSESAALFPSRPAIYSASLFTQSLLERLCSRPQSTFPAEYQQSLLRVLSAEMASMPPLPLQMPLPVDRRARNIADELLAHPDCLLDQTALGQRWGVSVRTLSRLFRQQTGLSFSQWRQQAKVVASLQWVLAGLPVSEIAARSGYSNISAYIEVFRSRFGVTPGQFQMRSVQDLQR
ncbi:AraC family transcriptional regulator [Phytobacter sp. V91]|uniref:helix-turn-helix transcriptional regulator n=1 Tax=Phytobacter sp. V91 TaxID=3369425 RepID=UPI003F629762